MFKKYHFFSKVFFLFLKLISNYTKTKTKKQQKNKKATSKKH